MGKRTEVRLRSDSGKERRETGSVRIRAQPVCVDAGNTIFMLMLRTSGSVFKLCKSNINAKPVINNFSASRGEKFGDEEEARERGDARQSVRRKNRFYNEKRRESEGEKRTGIQRGDGKRLYYTCLEAFSLRLREQDEKVRTSLGLALPHVSCGQGQWWAWRGEVGGTSRYPPKRGGGVLTLR